MRPNRWIFLSLVLGAALLSAWLSPALSLGASVAASGPPAAALAGEMSGGTLLRSGQTQEVRPSAILAYEVQSAISLSLLDEDSEIYLPAIRK